MKNITVYYWSNPLNRLAYVKIPVKVSSENAAEITRVMPQQYQPGYAVRSRYWGWVWYYVGEDAP